MSRPSRTISLATTSGELAFLSIDRDGRRMWLRMWRRIEKTYGHSLSESVRQAIREATTNFVLFEPSERAAQPLSLARARVLAVQKAAKDFYDVLSIMSPTLASTQADHFIEFHFADPCLADGEKFQRVGRMLSSLSAACNSALKELDDRPGYREGERWDQWICHLTSILKDHDLPTEVSKGTKKGPKDSLPSPFQRLVVELQKCVPMAARRHAGDMVTTEALAAAIHRARKTMRDTIGRDRRPNLSRHQGQKDR